MTAWKHFIPKLQSKDMLCEILEYMIAINNFHELYYLARSICKQSVQLLRFTQFKKQCRPLSIIINFPNKFDYGYRYDLTVSEAQLFKLPIKLEINSLSIIGQTPPLVLDTQTTRMIVQSTLEELAKQNTHPLLNCKEITTVNLSPHWEIIFQVVCQKLQRLDLSHDGQNKSLKNVMFKDLVNLEHLRVNQKYIGLRYFQAEGTLLNLQSLDLCVQTNQKEDMYIDSIYKVIFKLPRIKEIKLNLSVSQDNTSLNESLNQQYFSFSRPIEIKSLTLTSSDEETIQILIQTLLKTFKSTAGINMDSFSYGVSLLSNENFQTYLNPYIWNLLTLMKSSNVQAKQFLQKISTKNKFHCAPNQDKKSYFSQSADQISQELQIVVKDSEQLSLISSMRFTADLIPKPISFSCINLQVLHCDFDRTYTLLAYHGESNSILLRLDTLSLFFQTEPNMSTIDKIVTGIINKTQTITTVQAELLMALPEYTPSLKQLQLVGLPVQFQCVRQLMADTFFARKVNSRWANVTSLTIEVVQDDAQIKLKECFPEENAEPPTQLREFVFRVKDLWAEVSCLSIENLVLWVGKIPKLEILGFHFANCHAHVVESLIDQMFSNISIFGLPESLRHFHLSSQIYLGSFRCLEPLILFVLQQARTKLQVLEIDLNLGIAVDNTEKMMQSFQHLLDVNRTIIRLQIPKLMEIKNLKTTVQQFATWRQLIH